MKRPLPGLFVLLILLTACVSQPTVSMGPALTRAPDPVLTDLPVAAQPFAPTVTLAPIASSTPVPTGTVTPTITITPTWAFHQPGTVVAPILLYHRIGEPVNDDRYSVSPEVFKTQMEALAASGYTSISMAKLVDVMNNGGEMPARPVVITFDDGYLDVYENAFPVMQAMGYTGTVYIVTKVINEIHYMTTDALKALVAAGWEVGSHTKTHSDLTKSKEGLKVELEGSREDLEALLGVPVKSISYPYGIANDFIMKKAGEYGYESGAGLGGGSEHRIGSLMFLSRIEVRESYSLGKLGSLLPWWDGPPDIEPTGTPTP